MLISAVLPEILKRLQDRQAMLALLAAYQRQQLLSQLDLAFARFLAQNAPTVQPLSLLLAALLSRQVGRGHVCLPLADLLADASELLNYQSAQLTPEALRQQDGSLLPDPAQLLASYSLKELEAGLAQCATVLTVTPANAESIASAAPGRSPGRPPSPPGVWCLRPQPRWRLRLWRPWCLLRLSPLRATSPRHRPR